MEVLVPSPSITGVLDGNLRGSEYRQLGVGRGLTLFQPLESFFDSDQFLDDDDVCFLCIDTNRTVGIGNGGFDLFDCACRGFDSHEVGLLVIVGHGASVWLNDSNQDRGVASSGILGNMVTMKKVNRSVQRVQTGFRVEKRLLKVLKGIAETLDLTLGDLVEGIVLHAFENRPPFSGETLAKIVQLKEIYGLDLGAEDSHRLEEVKE